MRLRWLMLLIVLVALAVGPAYRYVMTLRRRSQEYAEAAMIHDVMVKTERARASLPRSSEDAKKQGAWHLRQRERYTEAASRPWTTVNEEPGPPAQSPPSRPTTPLPDIPETSKPVVEMTEAEKAEYLKERMKFIEDLRTVVQKRREERKRPSGPAPAQ